MVKDALLDSHVEAGANLVRELDRQNKPLKSAVWYFYPDISEWRLLLASPEFEAKGSMQAYAELSNLLRTMGPDARGLSVDDIKVVLMNDKLVPVLRKIIHAQGLNTIRMTSNMFDGTYVDDMLIYRNE